jgi:hypothetical protein
MSLTQLAVPATTLPAVQSAVWSLHPHLAPAPPPGARTMGMEQHLICCEHDCGVWGILQLPPVATYNLYGHHTLFALLTRRPGTVTFGHMQQPQKNGYDSMPLQSSRVQSGSNPQQPSQHEPFAWQFWLQ